MSEKNHRQGRVLYIAVSPNGESDALTQALRECGSEVEVFEDVYRGLARLGRSGAARFDAVVLCLDGLAAAEYAFITEANRCAEGIPVYVHAGRQLGSRIPAALELGARAAIDATAESVASIFDEGESTPVRVPWHSDGHGPVRKPPEHSGAGRGKMSPALNDLREVSTGGTVSEEPGVALPAETNEPEGPLLTAEEIRLLLSEDDTGQEESSSMKEAES